MNAQLEQVPGFLFFDHVAIAVKPGELDAHVKAYQAMGFSEMHREDVLGGDQVREVLLQVGDGPNLVQLLEPLTPESPVAKQIEKNGGRGGMAHVALRVADIQKAFDYLKREGLQDHRQGAAQGFARHHGVLRASEDDGNGGLRLSDRGGAGGQLMPEVAAGTRSESGADFPPVTTAEWEAAIAERSEGRRLREEAGVAHRGRPRGAALLPQGGARRAGGAAAYAAGPFPFVRGTGASWEIAQDAAPAPRRSARICCTRPARTRCRSWATRWRRRRAPGGADRTRPVDRSRRADRVRVRGGPGYFFEIAKLRAARLLWAQAVAAFGRETRRVTMRLHVRTPRRNKSIYDRYTNLLRVTTEALAAAVGGCDRLTVEPFGFDPHLALNVQRILKEEAHLDAVADPAGGSYYIEALTDALAREAWKLFQQMEAEGGYAKALAVGQHRKGAGRNSRGARRRRIPSRRRTLVGVNNYPDIREKAPGAKFRPRTERPVARRCAWPSRSRQIRRRTARARARDRTLSRRCCC